MSILPRWIHGLFRGSATHSTPELFSKIDLTRFEGALQYSIKRRELFLQSVLHRSYSQLTSAPHLQSNERLEFLGDSVLSMVVAERLFRMYPDAAEGKLTVMRARLVNRKALVYYAKLIHLRDFLLLSSSASQTAEKGAETILADAYEAVIGAIYLDGGLEEARRFVYRQLSSALQEGFLREADENYKSALLEFAQANGKIPPRYSIVKEEGPDHDRTFTVEVTIGEGMTGVGKGKNKKEAEQAAAENALVRMAAVDSAADEHEQH